MIPNLAGEGSSLLRGVFPQLLISRWREIADRHYARIESLVPREGDEAGQRQLPPGHRYLPHFASINLEGVYGATKTQRILDLIGGAALPRSPVLPLRTNASAHEAGGGALPPARPQTRMAP